MADQRRQPITELPPWQEFVGVAPAAPATGTMSLEYLTQQLFLTAQLEAWMEFQRCFVERTSLDLVRRWLEEWSTRKRRRDQLFASADGRPAGILVLPQSALRTIQEEFALLCVAFDRFQSAFEEHNRPLLLRWLEEWRARKARYVTAIEPYTTELMRFQASGIGEPHHMS